MYLSVLNTLLIILVRTKKAKIIIKCGKSCSEYTFSICIPNKKSKLKYYNIIKLFFIIIKL